MILELAPWPCRQRTRILAEYAVGKSYEAGYVASCRRYWRAIGADERLFRDSWAQHAAFDPSHRCLSLAAFPVVASRAHWCSLARGMSLPCSRRYGHNTLISITPCLRTYRVLGAFLSNLSRRVSGEAVYYNAATDAIRPHGTNTTRDHCGVDNLSQGVLPPEPAPRWLRDFQAKNRKPSNE